jgi:hypothetical protein
VTDNTFDVRSTGGGHFLTGFWSTGQSHDDGDDRDGERRDSKLPAQRSGLRLRGPGDVHAEDGNDYENRRQHDRQLKEGFLDATTRTKHRRVAIECPVEPSTARLHEEHQDQDNRNDDLGDIEIRDHEKFALLQVPGL